MIKKVLNNLKSYFEVSNFERRGVYSLLFILLLFASFYWYKNNYQYQEIAVNEEAKRAFAQQIQNSFSSNYPTRPSRVNDSQETGKGSKLMSFNPNKDTYNELVAKGLKPNIAQNIVNYRTKGGYFKKREDLAKLYVISSEYFIRIEPFIIINPPEEQHIVSTEKQGIQTKEVTNKPLHIELNTATIDELIKLKGIGKYYAGKIKRDVEWKGGYYTIDQLYDIKDIPKETIDDILTNVSANPQYIKRIPLNSADFETLRKHPYLKYKEAEAIINYREQHGKFRSLDELKKIHLLKGKDFNQLLPYLDLN